MITSRDCPICGKQIKFSYVVPDKSYIVEKGEFIRDDSFMDIPWSNPGLEFYCSNDKEHDIDKNTIIYEQKYHEWEEEIANEFYEQSLYDAP